MCKTFIIYLNHNPYCIIEMNQYQRQTTHVLCDTLDLQWNVSFRFFIFDINKDIIICSIYNRSKYTKDCLLGSIKIPLRLLIRQQDSVSIYSLGTNHIYEMSIVNLTMRTFYLEHSSNNSQISIKYIIHLNE
ncbi:unnamed protein product [Rotaria sp. Silwood2]|nr:unnamed protein product [Rotaria sp. Silwood2]CAF3170318.1 unnamed protein product [Rotaria sp. Silwood2]CAF3305842.1 unnamed protein product [Rotaria sp. Silwood2]